MTEHRLEVTRTARYETRGVLGSATGQVWFACHGYRQLASRFIGRFEPLDDGTRYLVAPEALSRFYVDPSSGRHGPEHRVGASWMTREDREAEIQDYVRYLDALADRVLADAGHAAVVVLGFSQGAHTAARWVALGRIRPQRLVLWGAYLPGDLDMDPTVAALEGVPLTLVRGQQDPNASEELDRAEAERLERWGIAHEVRTHPGGHEIDVDVLLEVAAETGLRTPPRT